MLLEYLEETFLKKLPEGYRLESSKDVSKDAHRAWLVEMENERRLFIVSWDEKGFRNCDIEFFLDPEKDMSLIKGLDFYLKQRNTINSHIMFRNYGNFMQFFDIIVVGSLKKIW